MLLFTFAVKSSRTTLNCGKVLSWLLTSLSPANCHELITTAKIQLIRECLRKSVLSLSYKLHISLWWTKCSWDEIYMINHQQVVNIRMLIFLNTAHVKLHKKNISKLHRNISSKLTLIYRRDGNTFSSFATAVSIYNGNYVQNQLTPSSWCDNDSYDKSVTIATLNGNANKNSNI